MNLLQTDSGGIASRRHLPPGRRGGGARLARSPAEHYPDRAGRGRRGVYHLIDARRQAIRAVASQHQVGDLRWWPPTVNPTWLDFVIEDLPDSLPAFRSDLESALGCRVAVYLAGQIPQEAWGSILVETVAL